MAKKISAAEEPLKNDKVVGKPQYVRDVVCTTTTYMCELKRKLISNRKRLISQTQEKMPKSLKKSPRNSHFPFVILKKLLMKEEAKLYLRSDLSNHCAIQ